MPFGRIKSEKYELNPSDRSRDTYGACRKAGEDEDYILSRDELEEETDSLSNDCGIVMPSVPKCDKYTYFRDSKRKIDYVLVYEEYPDDKPLPKGYAQKSHKHEAWRKKFMANLVKAGLHMEEETVESESSVIHFIKLSAPWPVLVHYAEQLCMRAPLQAKEKIRWNL